MIEVAAAIIRNDEGQILICQRGPGGNCGFLWEFPGGKREPGETLQECVKRECKEELDINIEVGDVFAETTYRYPDKEIAFTFFEAKLLIGVPKATVHKDFEWVKSGELERFEFCPADVEVVKRQCNT